MQTLSAIRIQLYHQCFEKVEQHNFTSIIGLRRSTQRPSIFEGRHIDHPSSKVDISIIDSRRSTRHIDRRPSKVDTSIFEGRHIDHHHIDLRRSKAETSQRQPNILPTFQQFVTEYCPQRRSVVIPKIPRGTIDK